LAAVRWPAREFGPPNLARFSGVSGTGPLVTIRTVALAGWPAEVAAGAAVLELVAPAPVVVELLVSGLVVEAGAPVLGADGAPVLGDVGAPVALGDDEDGEPDGGALEGSVEEVSGVAPVLGCELELELELELEPELGWARAAPATSKVAAPARARSFSCMAPRTPGCANLQMRPTRHLAP
jgi:hypothetical protein